jgi:PAS domain S-box-containing protein
MLNNPTPAAAHLAAIVESSNDAIISKDLSSIITSWNRGAEMTFGHKADEVIGKSITILMPEDRINEEPSILERIKRGEGIDHYETIRMHKDGRLLDISLTVSPIFDENGVIIGASKIARDVTDRKRAEAELNKLAAIVESSSDAIISKDLNGIITSWNPGACSIFGYTPEEAIGKPVTMLMPPERVNEEPAILERIRRGEIVDHYETIRRHKDGRLLNISLNVSPVYDQHGVIIGASKIARNVTELKRAESARRESEIMHRLVDAQESERHRIARDLHDHLGQQMTGLRLKIQSLSFKSAKYPELRAEIDSIRDIALQMDRDIGFLSWELRPTELNEFGLSDALKSFVREWSAQHGIRARCQCEVSGAGLVGGRLDPDIETNLYRIVQEALNNILKHAKADNVSVLLQTRKNEVTLIIEDDGVGFDFVYGPAKASKFSGFGLIGMHERAALLNGTLEIESRLGAGTSVIVHVPFERTNGQRSPHARIGSYS